MRLLLDTHVLLAFIERGALGLPTGVAGLLMDRESEHHLSAASLGKSRSSGGWANSSSRSASALCPSFSRDWA